METKQITLRLPVSLYQKLRQEAERKGVPKKDYVMIILWAYLDSLT